MLDCIRFDRQSRSPTLVHTSEVRGWGRVPTLRRLQFLHVFTIKLFSWESSFALWRPNPVSLFSWGWDVPPICVNSCERKGTRLSSHTLLFKDVYYYFTGVTHYVIFNLQLFKRKSIFLSWVWALAVRLCAFCNWKLKMARWWWDWENISGWTRNERVRRLRFPKVRQVIKFVC